MNPGLPMPVASPARSARRFTVAALLSALAGLLVPKCPLCLAAYLSAAGVGVSVAQGAAPILLRVANGVVATALSGLAARVVLRMWKTRDKEAGDLDHPDRGASRIGLDRGLAVKTAWCASRATAETGPACQGAFTGADDALD
jgi:hypothetical protein